MFYEGGDSDMVGKKPGDPHEIVLFVPSDLSEDEVRRIRILTAQQWAKMIDADGMPV